MDFYPSISEELLTKSINYAKSITLIEEEEVITTVFHARKLLLYGKTNVWVKNDNSDIDVTMGSYDGAEMCDFVGLYLLTTSVYIEMMASHVSKTFQVPILRK